VSELLVQRLHPDARTPAAAYSGDAGLDLASVEELTIPPGGRAVVGTGLAVAIPDGHAGFVQPRSGLAARHGVTVVNSPGLIDAGYRGEVKVLLLNTDPQAEFEVSAGERVAQLVVAAVAAPEVVEVAALGESARAEGGFGSTGR
jgi:dUTP pyrophosphatase